MDECVRYREQLSSPRTTFLFVLLTLVFLLLLVGCVRSAHWDGWAAACLAAFLVFLFYSLNYRTLTISLGGAGIHFMRVSFNFLEYPRLALVLRHPVGPVRELSFSTRRPDSLRQALADAQRARMAGGQ